MITRWFMIATLNKQKPTKMPDIYYDPRHIQEEALKSLQEALSKLANHTHTQTKILQGVRHHGEPVYRARLNNKHRIIYTWVGTPRQLLVLSLLENHKYDQVNRQLEGTTTQVQSFSIDDKSQNNNNLKETEVHLKRAPAEYLPQKELIIWDEHQQRALKLAMPMVLTGPPGSGKSAVLLELLYQYTQTPREKPILFLSQSQALVEQMQGYYEQEQAAHAQVNVMHFRTWEQLLAQSLTEYTCVGKGVFTQWLKNADKTLDPKTSYYELSLIAALGMTTYQSLPLGKRQSYYSDNQSRKVQHIKLLQEWLDFLTAHKFFDPMVSTLPAAMKQVYDGIFCDELQNLPPVALASVLNLSVAKDVVFCMDLHQCLISSPFIDAGLKLLVQQYWDCKLTEHTLPKTWRSTQAVVAAANSLMHYKCSLDKFTRRAYSNLESALSDIGVVSWVNLAQINQLERFNRDDTAIIVHDLKDPALASFNAMGFHYVLTPEQAIGLEFRTVILVNLMTHLWDLFKHKAEHEDLTIEEMIALHRVFVALSRAMKQVFIVETQKKPIQNWAQKVLGSLPENQLNALPTTQTVSKEQWLSRVKLHLQNEQDDPARMILANYLNFSEAQVNEYLQENKKSTVIISNTSASEPKKHIMTESPKGAKKKKKNNRPKNVQSLQSPPAGQPKTKIEKKIVVDKKSSALTIDLNTVEQQTQLKLHSVKNLIPKKLPEPPPPAPKFSEKLLNFLKEFTKQPDNLSLLMNSSKLTEFLFEAPVFEKERLFTRLLKSDFAAEFLQQLAPKKDLIASYLFPENIESFKQERVDFLIDLCMSREGLQFFELLIENEPKVSAIIEFLSMHIMPSRHYNTSLIYWLSASAPGQNLIFKLVQKYKTLAGCLGELILSCPTHCEKQFLCNLMSALTGVSILNFLDTEQKLSLTWEGMGAFSWQGHYKDFTCLLSQLFFSAQSIEMNEGQKISLELISESIQINFVVSHEKDIRTYGLVHGKLVDWYYPLDDALKIIPHLLFKAGKPAAPQFKFSIMSVNPAQLKMPDLFDVEKIIENFNAHKADFPLVGLHCANPDFIKKITDKSVQLQPETEEKQNVFHIAVLQANVSLINLFARNNPDLNAQDKRGLTPVNFAAFLNRSNLVELFLDYGACVNIPDVYGRTPLHYAVLNNNTRVMKLLLETNSDVTLKDAAGKSAYCYANESVHRGQLVKIFIQNNMDVNYPTSDQITAAAYALLQEDEESFAYLAGAGANLNSPMSNGETLATMILGANFSRQCKARMLQILFKYQVNFAICAFRDKVKINPIIHVSNLDYFLAGTLCKYMSIFHGYEVEFLKAKMMIENSANGLFSGIFKEGFMQSVEGRAILRKIAASENDEDLNLLTQNQTLLAEILIKPDFQLDVFLYLLSRKKSMKLVASLLSHEDFIEQLSFELLTQKIEDPVLPFYGTSMLFWFCYSLEQCKLFVDLLERKPLLLKKLTFRLFEKEHLFHLPITPIQLLATHREGRLWLESKLYPIYRNVYEESTVFDLLTLECFLEDYIKCLTKENPTCDKPVIVFQSVKGECTGLLLNDHQWIVRDSIQNHDFINCNNLESFLNELNYFCAEDGLLYLKVTIFASTNHGWELLFNELQVYELPEIIDYRSLCKLHLKYQDQQHLENLLSDTEISQTLMRKHGEQLISEAISLNNHRAVELLFENLLSVRIKSGPLPFEKLMHYAIEQNKIHWVQKIIDTGIDLERLRPKQDILFQVVITNQPYKLPMLALLKIPLDKPMNFQEDTAIIVAAKEGKQELFEQLFRFGANIHKPNIYGFTAVFWSIMRRDAFMLKSISSDPNDLPLAIETTANRLSDFHEGINEAIHIKNIRSIWDKISALITKKYNAGGARLTVSALELARIVAFPEIVELLEAPTRFLPFFNQKVLPKSTSDDKENWAPAMNK